MSVLDALSILVGGVGKGYRASQAAKQAIIEAKRKALMEEREQDTREALASSEMAQGSSRMALQDAQRQESQFDLETKRGASSRRLEPIGQKAKLLGLPDDASSMTGEDIDMYDPIIRERMGNRSRENIAAGELTARRNNPELFGGKSRTPQTVEEARADLYGRAINNPTLFEGAKPEEYVKRVTAMFDAIDERVDRNYGVKQQSDSTGTKTKTLSDKEAYDAYLKRKKGKK